MPNSSPVVIPVPVETPGVVPGGSPATPATRCVGTSAALVSSWHLARNRAAPARAVRRASRRSRGGAPRRGSATLATIA